MSMATADLLFWIVALLVLFFLFRWLQARGRKDRDDDE